LNIEIELPNSSAIEERLETEFAISSIAAVCSSALAETS